MEVIWGNRLKPGKYKYIGDFPHFVADAGVTELAAGSTKGSTSATSMPRSGRIGRRRTWSMLPCFVTATIYAHRQHQLSRLRPA
jgi:hypothetical protein